MKRKKGYNSLSPPKGERIFLKKRIFVLFLALILVISCFCGCSNENEAETEINPDEFSYDMLDLSIVVNEIYKKLEITDLVKKSLVKVTDETFVEEQYYLDLDNVVSYEIRYADGRYGTADVAIIRVKEGKAEEVMSSLENRKDDRINEFRNYDVYDSYSIAMNAEIYQEGELVIMLMLSEDDKISAKETINYYLP